MAKVPLTPRRESYLDARIRHEADLARIGWEQEGTRHWRNPRGMRIVYTVSDAIALEKLRGGIRQRGKPWAIV